MDIMGFETTPKHTTRCMGVECGMLIGPSEVVKSGFIVKDGDVQGIFHSRSCYENSVEKFNDHKSKGGDE
jgi:hypothetical protein